jgi:hypothetical protein
VSGILLTQMTRAIRASAALLLAIALAVVTGVIPQSAFAADGMIVTSHTRYEVRPDEGLVIVTIEASATNVTAPTATEEFYFTGMTLPLHAGATQIAASSGGAVLPATIVDATDDYVAVDVLFGVELLYRQTYAFQLSYLLRDDGVDPRRDTVIRQSFVGFPVWAFGSPDATTASVEVTWPRGYSVDVPFGSMRQSLAESGPLLTADAINDPTTFIAYVTGEREVPRIRHEFAVEMATQTANVLMLAWPDDPGWLERQTDHLLRGLPELERAIGVAYPVDGTLSVSEHAQRHLGGYAGIFNPQAATIQLRYDADAGVALHEAAHAWFNGSWFADRWIDEAFATYYAERVANQLGLQFDPFELTPELQASAFPLNAWLEVGLDDPEREDYAYAATPVVAAAIVGLAGDEALTHVWQAAANDRLAYPATDDDLRAAGDPDPESWQRLLDLLENETSQDFDPIWVEWILETDDAALLAERESTRATYDATVSAADGWTLPRSTRLLMDAWSFAEASDELGQVGEVLDQRGEVDAAARELDLKVTPQLQAAFEEDGIAAARREAEEQLAALDAIASATTELAAEPQLIERIGLLGETEPEAALLAARSAFEEGDDPAAADAAADAVADVGTAVERGRMRVAMGAGALLVVDLLALAAIAARRRRPRSGAIEGSAY